MAQKSLRDLISVLEENGKLLRVPGQIVKETELMPFVKLQFRGLPEEQRKGIVFENVVSVTGKKYDASVAVACLAGSRQIYALGLGCEVGQINEKWAQAQLNPLKPVLVASGPCQEVVQTGKALEQDGVDALPVPVNTPGFTGLIRTTASHVITKDPETGVANCGCYSGKFWDRNLMTLSMAATHHGATHWLKCKEMGVPLQAAIVVGAPPGLAYTSVTSLSYGTDELAVAGGLAGAPLEVVKCKTVDLEVPALAEYVIEGVVDMDKRVGSTSYGEYTGYMCAGTEARDYLMRVTAITHRKNPVYSVFASQFPPSESSKVVQIGMEGTYYKHLLYDCNIPGILQVAWPESGGGRTMCIIRMKKRNPTEVWQALGAANAFEPSYGKIIIAVDEDIDPNDPDAVNWALNFRMQPHRDIHVMRGRTGGLDYSAYRPGSPREEVVYPDGLGSSSLLIDATLNWPYPPTSLPKKQYMDRAVEIWNGMGLPELKLKSPWYGYNLGYWRKEDEENADLIVKGDYKAVGRRLFKKE